LAPHEAETLELRLVVTASDGEAHEVAVKAEPSDRIIDVAAEVGVHLGYSGAGIWTFHVRRLESRLDADMALRQSGLRNGDEVELVAAGGGGDQRSPEAAANDAQLVVTGGRSTGTRWRLRPGTHTIGRSTACQVVIDDPAVSRSHAQLTAGGDGAMLVADLGSSNGTLLNNRPLNGSQPLHAGDTLKLGGTTLTLAPPPSSGPQHDAVDGTVRFNRPPRVARSQPVQSFSIDVPAAAATSSRLPISASVVPLGLAGVMFATTQKPVMLLFGALSPVMAVFSLLENRLRGGRHRKRSTASFRRVLDDQERSWSGAVDEEIERRRDLHPDAPAILARATSLDARLWERRRDTPDFLHLRVGIGDAPASLEVAIGRGNEELRTEARHRVERHATLLGVPLTVSLATAGSIAVGGTPDEVAALGRSLAAQIAGLHSPRDVVLAAAVAAPTDGWRWLGWLPHAQSDGSPFHRATVVAGVEPARELVLELLGLVDERNRDRRSPRAGGGIEPPRVVAFLEEGCRVPRALLSRLLEQGPAQAIHTIWLGTSVAALPGECGSVVELREDGSSVIIEPRSGVRTTCAHTEGLEVTPARTLALLLAPIRDASSVSSAAQVPSTVGLLHLLELGDDPTTRVEELWRGHHDQLEATIGVAQGGPFSIGLRQDGPHALVGGTTGSGKSELLQGVVAALAAQHPPTRLTFLLVDYKGGAAFKECMKLPHTVGLVTDLDGHLVQRALRSLRAELKWREGVLGRGGAKSLPDLERSAPDTAPPSLLIVVDEFAALASEVPEFVDGVVSIAALGRSLGIHLVLATQRPAGVINDKIRANTNLRIALRFIDQTDSRDVIGSPAAAQAGLPPGRAFAKVGSGSLTEFQSVYGGGHSGAHEGSRPVIRDLLFGGVVDVRGGAGPEAAEATDLEVLVNATAMAAQRLKLPQPRRPWLPELPEVLPVADLPAAATDGEVAAVLGLADLPDLQQQTVRTWAPRRDGNLLIYGATGTGKTSLLRTIAAGLTRSAPPDQLHLYALDYAPPGLAGLAGLPHCGDVIRGSDLERTTRLIDMLRGQLDHRRAQLADAGAAGIEAFVQGGGCMPRVVVLLDGYSAFAGALGQQEYGSYIEALTSLAADGRSAGLHLVITVDRRASVSSKLAAACDQRIILRLSSEDDYAMLGLTRDTYRGARLPVGRCFIDKGTDMQCAVLGAPDGAEQNQVLRTLGDEVRARHGEGSAPSIRVLPAVVNAADLPAPEMPGTAIIGLRSADLEPQRVTLADGPFAVIGPPQSGRSTALWALSASLARGPAPPELHLLAPRRQSPLLGFGVWSGSHAGVDACVAAAIALAERVNSPPASGVPVMVVVVIDDADELLDPPVAGALETLVRRGPDAGFYVVAALEVQAARGAFAAWVKALFRHRTGLLLAPDPMSDAAILGFVKLPRRDLDRVRPGRGVLVRRGVADAVQVALP
jgi:S-DNA-T family DNA segregation ATPase FtsK/SpoIIIE